MFHLNIAVRCWPLCDFFFFSFFWTNFWILKDCKHHWAEGFRHQRCLYVICYLNLCKIKYIPIIYYGGRQRSILQKFYSGDFQNGFWNEVTKCSQSIQTDLNYVYKWPFQDAVLSDQREVQCLVCSYLHQKFIADPNLAKLVHFQVRVWSWKTIKTETVKIN